MAIRYRLPIPKCRESWSGWGGGSQGTHCLFPRKCRNSAGASSCATAKSGARTSAYVYREPTAVTSQGRSAANSGIG